MIDLLALAPRIPTLLETATPEEKAQLEDLLQALVLQHRDHPPTFAEFLSLYVYTSDHGGTKMVPWPWQLDLAKALPHISRAIILKGRQIGASWTLAAYSVYTALWTPGAKVLLVSQTEPDAKELLDKCRCIYDFLPTGLQAPANEVISNSQILRFLNKKSQILALPSTKRAGRGHTARLVVGDEHAFHEYAEDNFASLDGAVKNGGQFFPLSTANGVGNTYANLWAAARQLCPVVEPFPVADGHYAFGNRLEEAIKTHNPKRFLPIFLPYCVHPERDEAWWLDELAAKPKTMQWVMHQELPRDAEEAFIQTGRAVFDIEYVRLHRGECCEPLPKNEWPENLKRDIAKIPENDPWGEWPDITTRAWNGGELKVWAAPESTKCYLGGVDVAEGLLHGDYSHLVVLDGETREEILTLHGHWPPDEFATLVDRIARVYPGMYGVERNNHGHTVLAALQKLATPGVYRERPVYGKLGQVLQPGKRGWLTSTITKPLMIDELEQALRTFALRLQDGENIQELTFYKTFDDGKTGAPPGQFDDRVMALAIAFQMSKFVQQEPEDAGVPALPLTRYQKF